MQVSITERVLRTLSLALHVALPLLLLGLLAVLPTLERSARYPWFVGVAALTVATAAAAASVLAFRRVVRDGRPSHVLAATGFGALAATCTFAAITTLTGAANTLAPHDTVGRFALAVALSAGAWARHADARGATRGLPRLPDVRQRALRAAFAFVGIELVLGASALLGAAGVGATTLSGSFSDTGIGAGLPVHPLVLADIVSLLLFFGATAALALQSPPRPTRVAAVAGTLLLAVGTIVLVLARPGHVDVALGQLTIATGCIAGAVGLLAAGPDRRRLVEGVSVLASRMDDGVFLFDESLALLWLNDAGRELSGLDRVSEGTGPTLTEVLGVTGASGTADDEDPRGRMERRPRYVEIDATPAGSPPLALAISEVRDDDARMLTLVVARDVTIQRQDAEDLERVSADLTSALQERDELRRALDVERADRARTASRDLETGVANESAILDRLRLEVAQARRYPHPLAIVLMEARSTDDAAAPLREVADRLQLRLRLGDALGRVGDRRFLVVLPHTEEHGAQSLAAAIRTRVGERPIQGESGDQRVELAMGVAVLKPGTEVSPDDLLLRATSRLEHDGAHGEPHGGTPPDETAEAAESAEAPEEDARDGSDSAPS